MLTAAVSAAVVLAATTFSVAMAQEATATPDVIPSPIADASPSPTGACPTPAEVADSDAGMSAEPRRLIVEAGDLWFAPNEITICADEPTVLALSGVGTVAHNLMVDDLGLQLHVGPGIESEVSLVDLPPGTYEFYCSIFGHRRAGMYGRLTVE